MSRSSSGTKAPAWRQTSEHGNSGPRQSTKKCLVSLLQLLPHPTLRLLFGFLIFLQFECEEQQSTAQEQSMSGCCRSVTGNARNSVPQVSWNICSVALSPHTLGIKPGHRDGGIFIKPKNVSGGKVLSKWLYIKKICTKLSMTIHTYNSKTQEERQGSQE